MSKASKATYTILLFLGYLAIYGIIQHAVRLSTGSYMTALDSAIPFMPEFVWLYHTLPFGIFFVMIFYIQRRRLFMRTFWACIIAAGVMSIFHILGPALYPRAEFAVTNLHEQMVVFTRQIDGAANTFPSGHVAFSWLMYLAMRKTKYALQYPFVNNVFLLWAIGVSLSTLVIKQHFVVDVFSGIATAILSFYAARLFLEKEVAAP